MPRFVGTVRTNKGGTWGIRIDAPTHKAARKALEEYVATSRTFNPDDEIEGVHQDQPFLRVQKGKTQIIDPGTPGGFRPLSNL